jgi:hypothetical protein
MLAVFCLAVAGALALGRLVERRGRLGTGLVALAAAGVVWDGWLAPLPILEAPAALGLPDRGSAAAVLELPLGDGDTAAMYRAMSHGLPVLNGYSGYEPPHYYAFRLGLERGERGILDPVREHGAILALVDRAAPGAAPVEALVRAEAGARALGEESGRQAYLLPPTPARAIPVLGDRLPLRVAHGTRRRGVFDLGEARPIGAVVLSIGMGVSSLPPRVTVEVAEAPQRWTTAWEGPIAALAVWGALRDPVRVPVILETPGAFGRLIRIRVDEWTIEEVAAFGPAGVKGDD